MTVLDDLPQARPFRLGGGGAVLAWPPPPREPWLTTLPGSYDKDIWFPVPKGPDKLFYRGNFCGIRVPGVPLLPGMAGLTVPPWNANRPPYCPPFMAQDFPRYFKRGMLDETHEILRTYVAAGYTHLQVSVCHGIEAGMSIAEFLEFCGLVRSYGLFVDIWFLGGVLDARDRGADYWRPVLQPWINALLANNLIDCACVGWQLDHFNTGDERMIDGRKQSPIQSIIDYLADQLGPHEIPLGTHWVNEAGAWNAPFDRFRWWRDQRNKLSFFHHQGDVDIPVDLYQAKLKDTLDPFGNGRMGTSGLFGDRPFGLVIYECSAQAQFDLRMDELTGDQRGFLLCCTKGATHVSGYGNGARRPDGSVL